MTARAGAEHWVRRRAEAITGQARAPAVRDKVLSDRLAAAIAHHEPGWRLPRRTALAKRYNVSPAEIDAVISHLASKSLVRQLPNGEAYRASPAEYWIPVEGVAGLGTRLDPMGSAIACQARHVSQRKAPQDVAWALGTPDRERVRFVRCVWAAGDDPVAVSLTYLPEVPADQGADADQDMDPFLTFASIMNTESATAVSVDVGPSHPSVARNLRLAAGQPVITVTIRFADCASGPATALTVVTMRPELFRVTIDTNKEPARAADWPAPAAAPRSAAPRSTAPRSAAPRPRRESQPF
jgi:DNA-binding GntR family transcriptional regulator